MAPKTATITIEIPMPVEAPDLYCQMMVDRVRAALRRLLMASRMMMASGSKFSRAMGA